MSDSDGIEIVGENFIGDVSICGNNDTCQLCSTNLHGLSDAERHDHYAEHCTGSQLAGKCAKRKPASVATSQPKPTPMKFLKCAKDTMPEDVFWYPTQAGPPPHNYAPGVLSILKEALKQSHRKGTTQRAVLCYERTPHICRESFDTNWGCGYRNFLMSCAALMDQQFQTLYLSYLNGPFPPSVRNLQHWLEDAWERGYDEVGARHFEGKLIGTKKKLGTGDLYVAFTSRRIPCRLVEFDLRGSPKGFDTLTDWVVNYFTEKHDGNVNKILTAPSVVSADKMPVIMQYDGHSVTIVGYELAKNDKYNLLVFDPSCKVHLDVRNAALNVSPSVGSTSSPASPGKSKRRGQSESLAPRKRSRMSHDPKDEVVSIPESDDEDLNNPRRDVVLKPTLDSDMVIKPFRLKVPKNKYEYQLLYFTLGNPLSDEEQNARKVVLSDTEC